MPTVGPGGLPSHASASRIEALADAGKFRIAFQNDQMRGVQAKWVQVDEI
jgi:hypothetical protein